MMQIMQRFRVWVMQVMQWPIHAVLRDVLRSAVVRCSRAAWLWFASDLDSGPSGYCPLDSAPPARIQIRLGIVATTDPSKVC